jgi:hypothetical protein
VDGHRIESIAAAQTGAWQVHVIIDKSSAQVPAGIAAVSEHTANQLVSKYRVTAGQPAPLEGLLRATLHCLAKRRVATRHDWSRSLTRRRQGYEHRCGYNPSAVTARLLKTDQCSQVPDVQPRAGGSSARTSVLGVCVVELRNAVLACLTRPFDVCMPQHNVAHLDG